MHVEHRWAQMSEFRELGISAGRPALVEEVVASSSLSSSSGAINLRPGDSVRILGRVCVYDAERDVCEVEGIGAVSYTHLTLPTKA